MATPRLNLDELIANQSSPELKYNEMARKLDIFVQCIVIDSDRTVTPTPSEGDLYIIGGAPTSGDWSTDSATAGQIAQYFNGDWYYITPATGYQAFDLKLDSWLRYTGATWGDISFGGNIGDALLRGYAEWDETTSSSTNSIDFDLSTGNFFSVTLTENITTITFSNVPTDNTVPISIEFAQNGTGGYTVTGWPASVKWSGGVAPIITLAANAVDVISGYTRDGGTTFRLDKSMEDSK